MSSPACVIKGVHKQLGTSNHLIHFKSLQEEGNNYGAPIWLVLGWFSVSQSPAEYYEIHFWKTPAKFRQPWNSSLVQKGKARKWLGFPSTPLLCRKLSCLKAPHWEHLDYKLAPDPSFYHMVGDLSSYCSAPRTPWQRPQMYNSSGTARLEPQHDPMAPVSSSLQSGVYIGKENATRKELGEKRITSLFSQGEEGLPRT